MDTNPGNRNARHTRLLRSSLRVLCALLIGTSIGCASTKFENTSPDVPPPAVDLAGPIDASVAVQSRVGGDLSHNDVAAMLRERALFREVVGAGEQAECLLTTHSDQDSNLHFWPEMAGAVFSGLTLGAGKFLLADRYDYSVAIEGQLSCSGRDVGRYSAVGSYHASVPDIAPLDRKTGQVTNAVQQSWQHALTVLAAKLARDRTAIENATR